MPFKLILLSGGITAEYELALDTTAVGRRATENDAVLPEIDFEWDNQVSRGRHCAVRLDKERILIRDCISKNGTYLNDNLLEHDREYALLPGEPVRTGTTVWTVIPAAWTVTRVGDVALFGDCIGMICYPLFPRDRRELKFYAINTGNEDIGGFSLKLEIHGYTDSLKVEIPEIRAYERVCLDFSGITLRYRALKNLKMPMKTMWHLETGYGGSHEQFKRDTTVMGLWDLPLNGDCWEAVAAYVSPFSVGISQIVRHAQSCLLEKGATFEALLMSGDERAEYQIFEAVYEHLRSIHELSYVSPVVQYTGVLPYQKINPLSLNGGVPTGSATCIDLSILLAGCLERAGLCPLILLFGDEQGRLTHALAGCWMGTTPGARGMIDDAESMRDELSQGNLLIAESTSLTTRDGGMDFVAAVARAQELLAESKWIRAVDVKALHPPIGNVEPLEMMRSDEVGTILGSSEEFAARKKRSNIELSHLLFGLLSESSLLKELLTGITPQAALEKLDKAERTDTYTGDIVPTLNYTACTLMAEEFARSRGNSFVSEQDLLWAFLFKCDDSAKTRKLCQECGIDPEQLKAALNAVYKKPTVNRTVSD
jgi:hypothetical protein